jgi:hypothetical protein
MDAAECQVSRLWLLVDLHALVLRDHGVDQGARLAIPLLPERAPVGDVVEVGVLLRFFERGQLLPIEAGRSTPRPARMAKFTCSSHMLLLTKQWDGLLLP